MSTVFISYRHRSGRELARAIGRALDEVNVPVWRDVEAIPMGAGITREVNRGLRDAAAVVLIFTPDYLDSAGCFLELAYVISRFTVDRTFTIAVVTPDDDWRHVKPAQLLDVRNDAWREGHISDLAARMAGELQRHRPASIQHALVEPTESARFGHVPVSSTLTVPIGHEHAFWQLHDLLWPRQTAQTSVGIESASITVASDRGGGSLELATTYARLFDECFPGGVFWVSERGGPDHVLAGLRGVGDALGLAAESLAGDGLIPSLTYALRARQPYLWLVLTANEGGGTATHPLLRGAPTGNGKAILVREQTIGMLDADVRVTSLARDAVVRVIEVLLSTPRTADLADLVFAKTGGHLHAVMSAVRLVQMVGVDIAKSRLQEMSAEEAGLRGFAETFRRLDDRKKELLRTMCVFPDAVGVPNSVIQVLFRMTAERGDAALGNDDLIALRAIGAMAQTPDSESWFLAPSWRAAAAPNVVATAQEATLTMVHAMVAADAMATRHLRDGAVRALIQVLPSDTRTRQHANLPQLAFLARHVLSTIRSESDCELAVRCAAVDALYGDHDAELAMVRRAHEWAIEQLGPMHPTTLGLVIELASCPKYPRLQALQGLAEAVALASESDVPASLVLSLIHSHAIAIGDRSPAEGLKLLEDAYARFAMRDDVEPMLHLRVRSSIAVFQHPGNPNHVRDSWLAVIEYANANGLAETQEAWRAQANLASRLAESGDVAQALPLGRAVFEHQLEQWGPSHHLALWATVDYLQYCLGAGDWTAALLLLSENLASYRELVRKLDRPRLNDSKLVDRLPCRFDELRNSRELLTPDFPPLNSLAQLQIERLAQVHRVAVSAYFRFTPEIALPRNKDESITRMIVFLELFELGRFPEPYVAAILDDFLRSLRRLEPIDWSRVRLRLRDYYVRLDGALPVTPKSNRMVRRIARALIAEQGLWARLRLKASLRALSLPAAHI